MRKSNNTAADIITPSSGGVLKSGQQAVMETASGQLISILRPNAKTINIKDIAHALANQCRYGGHSSKFYSVAEHSVKVARFVEQNCLALNAQTIILGALLHDASEAYLVDIPTPVKGMLTNYKTIEANLMRTIFERFEVKLSFLRLPKLIHDGDRYILLQEAKWLVSSRGRDWPAYSDSELAEYSANSLYHPRCWPPAKARRIFLREFRRLRGESTKLEWIMFHLHLFWI